VLVLTLFPPQHPTIPSSPSDADDLALTTASRDDDRRQWITRRQREVARRRNESAGSAAPAAHLRFAVSALAAALPIDGKRRLLALARDYAAGAVAPSAMAASLQELVDEYGVQVPLCHGAEARVEPSPRMFGRSGVAAAAAAANRPAAAAARAAAAAASHAAHAARAAAAACAHAGSPSAAVPPRPACMSGAVELLLSLRS
jgi:hypothetical protein